MSWTKRVVLSEPLVTLPDFQAGRLDDHPRRRAVPNAKKYTNKSSPQYKHPLLCVDDCIQLRWHNVMSLHKIYWYSAKPKSLLNVHTMQHPNWLAEVFQTRVSVDTIHRKIGTDLMLLESKTLFYWHSWVWSALANLIWELHR